MKLSTYFNVSKALFVGIILLALVVAGLKGYAWINMKFEHQEAQHKIELEQARQYKVYDAEAAANLARAHTEIGSLKGEIVKLKAEANSSNNALKEALSDIESKNEKIFNLGQTVASLEDNIRKLRIDSSHTYKAGTGDPNEQYFIDIMYPVKDKEGRLEREVPYAWAIFYPNKPANEQWKYGIYALDYNIRTIQTEQEDGQVNTYTEVWFENNRRNISRGYQVPVAITSSEFKQEMVEDQRFYWWAPHANLNLDFGIGKFSAPFEDDFIVAGGVSFSMMGYGRTTNDLTWRFLDFGISTDGDIYYAKFTPFTYNIGRHVPIISNTFIGPFVGYAFSGDADWVVGLGVSVPF